MMVSRSSCKHLNRRNIFGDEILQAMSAKTVRRQRCTDCGKPLNESLDPKGLAGERFMDTDALLATIDEVLADCGTLG
jgi:hypothetical protein